MDHPAGAWLVGPAQITAIRADDELIDRHAHGERPDLHDADPAAAALAAWLHEVAIGGAR
jgi:hypothetical protein